MNKYISGLLGMLASLLLAGCFPEQHVIWSPDGKQAVVVTKNDGELYLCDENGTLSPKQMNSILYVAWRPDSRGLVLVKTQTITAWAEAENALFPKEQEELKAAADTAHQMYAAGNKLSEAINAACETGAVNYPKNFIKLYLIQQYPELAPKLEPKEALHADLMIIQLAEVQNGTIIPGRVLSRTALPLCNLRVSPQNRIAACTAGEELLNLYAVSMEETAPLRQVATQVSLYPDWSADGRHLVYATGGASIWVDDELQLGAIARREVADDDGQLLPEFPERNELVGVIFNGFTRIRCLPDGGIVFSALEIQLPATAGDMPENMTLFRIDPERLPSVTRLIPRSIEHRLGDESMLFEFSPDGKQIALPDCEDGVGVLTVATGELYVIPDEEKKTTSENPGPAKFQSWRYPGELCVSREVQLGEIRSDSTQENVKQSRTDVLLINPAEKQTRIINAEWPAEVSDKLND